MSEAWFHVASVPAPGEQCALDTEEARHAVGARRLRAGAALTVFDGAGATGRGHLVEAAGATAVALIDEREEAPRLRPAVHLAFAPPKGDRAATLVSMTTQLGVASLRPLICSRGVVRPGDGALARWRRVSLEACKQCRSPWLPDWRPPLGVEDAARDAAGPAWLAHPGGQAMRELLGPFRHEAVTVLIGPEGGFTPDEVEAARGAGADLIDLGATILRTETAAVSIVAALRLVARTPDG